MWRRYRQTNSHRTLTRRQDKWYTGPTMAKFLVKFEREIEADSHTEAVVLFLTAIHIALRAGGELRTALIGAVRYREIDSDGGGYVEYRA